MRMWWNADTRVLGARTERCAGSSPVIRTKRERMDLPIKLLPAASMRLICSLSFAIAIQRKRK